MIISPEQSAYVHVVKQYKMCAMGFLINKDLIIDQCDPEVIKEVIDQFTDKQSDEVIITKTRINLNDRWFAVENLNAQDELKCESMDKVMNLINKKNPMLKINVNKRLEFASRIGRNY